MLLLSISPPSPFLPSKPFSKTLLFRTRATSVDSHETVSKSAIKRISDKLRQLGFVADDSDGNGRLDSVSGSAGEIFIPTPKEVPKYRVGSTIDSSWSSPETRVTKQGSQPTRFEQLWNRENSDSNKPTTQKESVPSVAELTLPRRELRRLISLGIRLKTRLKIGKAGITEGIVNGIHERWRRSEVVKVQCEDLCKLNMKRTHETLERKTGGLVVWRAGSVIILYRGSNYKYPYFHQTDNHSSNGSETNSLTRPVSPNLKSLSIPGETEPAKETDFSVSNGSKPTSQTRPVSPNLPTTKPNPKPVLIPGFGSKPEIAKQTDVLLNGSETGLISPNSASNTPSSLNPNPALIPGFRSKVRFQLPGESELANQTDLLLNGLGMRFEDWWGSDPRPVDADLLPGLVTGFRKPFRVLPSGVKIGLTDREVTVLRRLSRTLPCHFALGRNMNLQGLAEGMIKLWEKCEITKIAIKRGVQNADSDIMAQELKKLTGGTILSRDSEFIIFYRGKDFLPPAVSNAIDERRKYGNNYLEKQEKELDEREKTDERESYSLELRDSSESEVNNKVESKLSMVQAKKERAEKLLEELEEVSEIPKEEQMKESISQEEKFMLRKVGLKMKPFLLLGRRGAFDGTVENMHLHWKYRELVKIITREKYPNMVKNTAKILEKESGGILVSIDKINKGHAIIIYRGKNYMRPKMLRPKSLLSKREAMKKSLEAQRCKSLKLHVLNLSRNIDELKQQINEDESLEINSSQIGKQKSLTNYESMGLEGTMDSFEPTIEPEFQIHAETLEEEWFSEDEIEDSTQQTSIPNYETLNADENVCSTPNTNSDEKENLIESNKDEIPFKASPLSNKERLFLRKQALKMKKRPVLSVGRNNVISGVAKTIKTHFIKHPLAIVNIKGRADGTPVQQLILELEAATGAVLVSVEPNKVILYRGWGADETNSKQRDVNKNSNKGENEISAELMEAIRVECGFEPSNE